MLPLFNNNNAVMSGVCIDNVTAEFPMFPLIGKVEDDIQKAYQTKRHNINSIPKEAGSETDFMIGIHEKLSKSSFPVTLCTNNLR